MRKSSTAWFAALLMLGACSADPTEQALIAAIDRLEAAGEARDVDGFMDNVGDDFAGNGTELDQQGLERYLRLLAMRHQAIGVTRAATQVQISGDRAVVKMQLLLTGGAGGLLPESGQLLDTESTWRFVKGDWQLAGARWKPAGQ